MSSRDLTVMVEDQQIYHTFSHRKGRGRGVGASLFLSAPLIEPGRGPLTFYPCRCCVAARTWRRSRQRAGWSASCGSCSRPCPRPSSPPPGPPSSPSSSSPCSQSSHPRSALLPPPPPPPHPSDWETVKSSHPSPPPPSPLPPFILSGHRRYHHRHYYYSPFFGRCIKFPCLGVSFSTTVGGALYWSVRLLAAVAGGRMGFDIHIECVKSTSAICNQSPESPSPSEKRAAIKEKRGKRLLHVKNIGSSLSELALRRKI